VRRSAATVTPAAATRAMRSEAIKSVEPVRPDDRGDAELRTAELFAALERTDDEAQRERLRQEITVLNLPLARRVAARYTGRGESFDDLFQVASMALVKAVRGFDPRAGSAFVFYAMPSMHGEVKRHFRDHSWGIRPPRHIQDSRGGVNDAVASLAQDLQRLPVVDEIVAATGLDEATVQECLASNDLYRLASIDAVPGGGATDAGTAEQPRGTDFAASLGDTDHGLEAVEDRVTLQPLIEGLGPRERRLLALRFVHEWTQAQIASEFGVSQVQVSRLLTKVLSGLREHLEAA
jgi:RNA polymerase sigma-B factor